MSTEQRTDKNISKLGVIGTAFYYFAFKRADKTALICFILFATMVKNVMSGTSRFMLKALKDGEAVYYTILIKILLLRFSTIGLNFICDALFEKALIPYGSIVSKIVLRNVLYTDNYRTYRMTGGHSEYFVVEGSKQLAKLNRLFIVGLWSKFVHCTIDFYFIFKEDDSSGKKVFMIIVFGTIEISCFKALMSAKICKSLAINNNLSYQREK